MELTVEQIQALKKEIEPFHQSPCLSSSHPGHAGFAKPIFRISTDTHLMVKIAINEFPSIMNVSTIQNIERQTGNRFREGGEYLVNKSGIPIGFEKSVCC